MKKTICSAAIEALKKSEKPLKSHEIFNLIIQNNLYVFKAKNPLNVLKAELRKHSKGNNMSLNTRKYFQSFSDGTFGILEEG